MNRLKFKPLKSRFRATFAGNQLGAHFGQIDEENEVLHDVQITLEGEAKGHGVWLDRQFCEDVAKAGNDTGDVGLKVRYGHPAMCSDAIGTELGRAKNFRVVDLNRTVDGETVKAAGVVADVYLLKSAHSAPQGDIAKHVIETAKEDPGQFGQSIVFTYADWKVVDANGNPHLYSEYADKKDGFDEWMGLSADGKVYAVLGKLHGSDFTDTPAATDGVFSTGTLAEEAEQMLDEHPQIMEVLEKSPKALAEFLERSGLADKLESARLSGLQAAKDKQLADLKAAHDAELADLKAAHDASCAELKAAHDASCAEALALRSQLDSLTADIDAKNAALAEANALVEQLRSKCAEAEKALADKQAALEVAETRYREQVGLALKPAEQFAGLHGRDRAIAALKARS